MRVATIGKSHNGSDLTLVTAGGAYAKTFFSGFLINSAGGGSGGGGGSGSSTNSSVFQGLPAANGTGTSASDLRVHKIYQDQNQKNLNYDTVKIPDTLNGMIINRGGLNNFNTSSNTVIVDKVYMNWYAIARTDVPATFDLSFDFYKCSFNGTDPSGTINSALIESFVFEGDNTNYFSDVGNRSLHINETKTFSSDVSLGNGEFISWQMTGTQVDLQFDAPAITGSNSTNIIVNLLEKESSSGGSSSSSW